MGRVLYFTHGSAEFHEREGEAKIFWLLLFWETQTPRHYMSRLADTLVCIFVVRWIPFIAGDESRAGVSFIGSLRYNEKLRERVSQQGR